MSRLDTSSKPRTAMAADAFGERRRIGQSHSASSHARTFVLLALVLSCLASVPTAAAFSPDTSGWLMENTFQVSHSDRLLYFFISIGLLAAAGLVFLVLIFSCDMIEKRRARSVDPERCLRHIADFEDRQCGRVADGAAVFDFHYFPSDVRPDYVVTDEMRSVGDAAIRAMRQQALQRRQIEFASRFVMKTNRSQLRLTTVNSAAGGPPTPPQAALAPPGGKHKSLDGTNKLSRPGTPMRPVTYGAGLTNSNASSHVPLSQQHTAGPSEGGASGGGVISGRGFYDGAGGGGAYDFGFDDDLDFELGS